jgi:hypothetical protein
MTSPTVPDPSTGTTPEIYEPPKITELGSVADLTQKIAAGSEPGGFNFE